MSATDRIQPIMCIAGIPGAGKTALATALHAHFGGTLISTGDIARRVDPAGVGKGDLADEEGFRSAFLKSLANAVHRPVWLDGFPRNEKQLSYLWTIPWNILVVQCRPDIARDRQLRRGRDGDTPEIVTKRTAEQTALLALDNKDGWLYAATPYGAMVNTSMKTAAQVADGFIAYLEGTKREAY